MKTEKWMIIVTLPSGMQLELANCFSKTDAVETLAIHRQRNSIKGYTFAVWKLGKHNIKLSL